MNFDDTIASGAKRGACQEPVIDGIDEESIEAVRADRDRLSEALAEAVDVLELGALRERVRAVSRAIDRLAIALNYCVSDYETPDGLPKWVTDAQAALEELASDDRRERAARGGR